MVGISTRLGGVSAEPYASLNMGLSTGDREQHVLQNRQAFLQALGVSPDDVVLGRLSHGNQVSVFRRSTGRDVSVGYAPLRACSSLRKAVFWSDGVVSDVSGLYFFLTFADCVPLVFVDPRRRAIGAAHAGWRGTALGIGPAVVRVMQETFGTDPADLEVSIGPSIGSCCYSVGADVIDAFCADRQEPVVTCANGAAHLDLWATNERQLYRSGVRAEAIENTRRCTSCNVDTFYSHRAEGRRTGRFAVCIGLR